MNYEVIFSGPDSANRETVLRDELSRQLDNLGLEYGRDVQIVSYGQADPRSVSCAVWAGAAVASPPNEVEAIVALAQAGTAVFPIVDSLGRFSASVPTDLRHLNGKEWAPIDAVVADLMRALRLLPDDRLAFISYKRTDSTGVAAQLFSALGLRGFRPFLDTASVLSGVDFQESLWCRMAGTDLLVFLDSPNAMTSTWIHQELARAHDLGLGVLQLVWPGHTRTPGTDLCNLLQLTPVDFVGSSSGADATLTQPAIERVLADAEEARIKSLALRRLHVVTDVIDQAVTHGLTAEPETMGPIRLFKGGTHIATVLPVVGLPDARIVHDRELQLDLANRKQARLTYNGLGASKAWLDHLDWLNERDGLRSVQVDLIGAWMGDL